MTVDSGLVGGGADLQDMVVSFLSHTPHATESITAPPNSHFIAVNVVSA